MTNKTLPRYYKTLFGAVEDALEKLDKGNHNEAREILIRGQLDAEALYISEK